jgi:hypothetical protein
MPTGRQAVLWNGDLARPRKAPECRNGLDEKPVGECQKSLMRVMPLKRKLPVAERDLGYRYRPC